MISYGNHVRISESHNTMLQQPPMRRCVSHKPKNLFSEQGKDDGTIPITRGDSGIDEVAQISFWLEEQSSSSVCSQSQVCLTSHLSIIGRWKRFSYL